MSDLDRPSLRSNRGTTAPVVEDGSFIAGILFAGFLPVKKCNVEMRQPGDAMGMTPIQLLRGAFWEAEDCSRETPLKFGDVCPLVGHVDGMSPIAEVPGTWLLLESSRNVSLTGLLSARYQRGEKRAYRNW